MVHTKTHVCTYTYIPNNARNSQEPLHEQQLCRGQMSRAPFHLAKSRQARCIGTQKGHVATWYIHGSRRISCASTSQSVQALYSCMDSLGQYGFACQHFVFRNNGTTSRWTRCPMSTEGGFQSVATYCEARGIAVQLFGPILCTLDLL